MRYFLASVCILMLGLTGILTPIRSSFHAFVAPVQVGLRDAALNTRRLLKFYSQLKAIREENLKLSAKLIDYKDMQAVMEQLKLENNLLTQQLLIAKELGNRDALVLANIMGNPSDLSGTTVFLNKGFSSGISEGDNVVVGKNIIGKVLKVDKYRSLVMLTTSPQINMTVYDISSGTKTQGVALGSHGTSIEMTRILPGELIQVGDIIMTSGKDGVFIPDYIVGRVTDVQIVPTEPLKSATIQPSVDLKSLTKVFVELSK